MIRRTGLAPWVFELPFPGGLTYIPSVYLTLSTQGIFLDKYNTLLRELCCECVPEEELHGRRVCVYYTYGVPNNLTVSIDSGSALTEMCSGSEAGSYLRLKDFCITQL